jgi:glycosyltransferase involved in cell wall biosynthesis
VISVIVPVRDDPRVDDLLVTLSAQRSAPAFEVLVALDGSRRQPRVPAGLLVRLLRLSPRGPYPARNAAAREARGELLLFTDSDCLCPDDWIARAARSFDDPALSALQGASVAFGRTRLDRFIQAEYELYVASHATTGFRRFCNTRAFAIRADVARETPLPDLHARGGDGVYGRLLESRGIAIRYDPDWRVLHRHSRTRWIEARKAFDEGFFGARWSLAGHPGLFGPSESGKGPGARIVAMTRNSRLARRAAAAALLPVAAVLSAASAALPEKPAAAAFHRSRRATHLAGRLFGEAAAGDACDERS